MIRIAICEDNKEDSTQMRKVIERFFYEASFKLDLYVYDSAEEMCGVLENITFDVVFLDIYMKQMNGIELAHKIRNKSTKTLIIFCTYSSDHALEGYQFRAFQYIVKPIHEKLLEQVLADALKHLETHKRVQYTFPSEKGIKVIYLEDIYYIESDIRKTIIHLREDSFKCTYNINTLEQKLQAFGFARCHRSYIVSLTKIKSIEPGCIDLYSGSSILVSKYKLKEMKKKVVDLFGGTL